MYIYICIMLFLLDKTTDHLHMMLFDLFVKLKVSVFDKIVIE